MSPQEFIENAPLYTRVEIEDFSPPSSITRMCQQCGKETTWSNSSDAVWLETTTSPKINIYTVGYTCVLCTKNSLAVIYQRMDFGVNPLSISMRKVAHYQAVRKAGQIPPPEIEIPGELNKRLGTTAAHYKKALVCRTQNYGIAAMAYLRRVVDEKTDELIDVMAEFAQTFQVSEVEIARLIAVKKEIRYEEKMKVAAELIPEAVKPAGVNPLGQLYQHLSVGLHGKSDDECIAIFDDLKTDFEYVFRNLHLQAEERREFAKRVQARAGKNPKA